MANTGGFILPDFAGAYRSGVEWGQDQAERKRRQPMVEQLEQLTLEKTKQGVTLQDFAVKEKQRAQDKAKIQDISNMAKWAQMQPDSGAAWDQGIDFMVSEGDQEAANYKGKGTPEFLSMMVGLDPNALIGQKPSFEQAKGKSLEGYVFDKNTGRYSISPEIKADLHQNIQESLEFKDLRSLNTDSSKIIKPANEIASAAKALEGLSSTASPTDQLAAVFKFMKALDPTSVVREGEQQQARETGGVTDQFIGYINKIRGEGALPETVLGDMTNTARNLANSAIGSSRDELTSYLNAYGDQLPKSNYDKQISRIPPLFQKGSDKNISNDEAPVVATQKEYDALPSGSEYIEDGVRYRKP